MCGLLPHLPYHITWATSYEYLVTSECWWQTIAKDVGWPLALDSTTNLTKDSRIGLVNEKRHCGLSCMYPSKFTGWGLRTSGCNCIWRQCSDKGNLAKIKTLKVGPNELQLVSLKEEIRTQTQRDDHAEIVRRQHLQAKQRGLIRNQTSPGFDPGHPGSRSVRKLIAVA